MKGKSSRKESIHKRKVFMKERKAFLKERKAFMIGKYSRLNSVLERMVLLRFSYVEISPV